MLCENVSLKMKVKLSFSHNAIISSQAYLRLISDIFHTYISISGISQGYIRHFSALSQPYIGLIKQALEIS